MGRKWTPAELLPIPGARACARISNFLRACEADAAASPTRLWGHKTTTEHIRGLRSLHPDSPFAGDEKTRRQAERFDYLGCFIAATKHIPVIYILRDGRACVRSKLIRANLPLDEAIDRWKFAVQVFDAYREAGVRLLPVKMEDLVSMPEATLYAVCDFIGVTYKPAMLAGINFDVSVLTHDNPPWTAEIRNELVACGYAV
jgi:Sulfotransferase family